MGGSVGRVIEGARIGREVLRTGILRPMGPGKFARLVRQAPKWGVSLAAGVVVSAIRYPRRPGIIDARGTLTWAEIDTFTSALARGLRHRGVSSDDTIGVMCRNHRGFIEATVAAAKLGCDAVLLNTGFSGPQLSAVAANESVGVLIHDESFESVVTEAGLDGMPRFATWASGETAVATTAEVAAGHDGSPVDPPSKPGAVTILTSGTTGTPKGARRTIEMPSGDEGGGGSPLGMIVQMPVRARTTTIIDAPMFHSWGFAHLGISLVMSNTMVLNERFDPEWTVRAIERHRARCLVAVPVMLQRMLNLPREVIESCDTSSLRMVALSGSALPGDLAVRFMDTFGDVIYNLYGSTEVGIVSVAGPADLREAPDTAGRVSPGVQMRLIDYEGQPVEPGQPGRIFVRTPIMFEGYTGGGTKETIGGFMSTGDVGRLDAKGRLYVEGREDDMIVSGGENVFPEEVEDVIRRDPRVADVVVHGVPDPEFGQRLRAVIVARDGEPPSPDEVRALVRERLARYKVPRDVVYRDELPRTTTGKVLRRVLKQEAEAERA